MKRGEVWRVTLDPRSGSEQGGVRPVIVMSSDVFNTLPTWNSFVVVPFSSSERQAARGPTAVALPPGAGGLSRESFALCHQITTVDRGKFMNKLGVLDPEQMSAVEKGIVLALGMVELLRRNPLRPHAAQAEKETP